MRKDFEAGRLTHTLLAMLLAAAALHRAGPAAADGDTGGLPMLVSDNFDDGILDPDWQVLFVDNGSGADDWIFDESSTQPSWLTVEDILSPLIQVNRWRIVNLVRTLPPTANFHVEAGISWSNEQPPGYPGDQNEASAGLLVRLLDADGNEVAIGGYRDNWGLHSADRWFWTPAGTSGDRPGELPLAGTATFEIARTGDLFEFAWDGISLFSIASVTEPVAELRLEFRTFDPSLDRFTPRSYLGTLAIDYLAFHGNALADAVAPTADAGLNQAIHAGESVVLDGTGSFDDTSTTPDLTYEWTFASLPPGSSAVLNDAGTAAASFIADVPGTFAVRLVVTDEAGNVSEPDLVEISSENVAPEASAGNDRVVVLGTTGILDGTGSRDDDGDQIGFAWTIASAPPESTATLLGAATAMPSLTPDRAGAYEIELIVNDGFETSPPDTVLVSAITGQEYAELHLLESNDVIVSFLASALDAPGHRNSLTNFVSQAIRSVQQGNIGQALAKLEMIIERTDGCPLRGEPDGNGQGRDWIVDCGAQDELYPLLIAARESLELL